MAVDQRAREDLRPTAAADPARHPLDPLSVEEIARAVRIVKIERGFGDAIRFETVELKEPPKAVVRAWRPDAPITREAFVAVFDIATDAVFEAVVDLTRARVRSWRRIEGARPTIMPEELAAV
ncbi:MAG TPA: hypothetical protein VFY19_00440, partial [Geminicoccaceae bacterium]|nr:hypothetical protein [Geminicoccaceae bacterium]